MKVRGKFGKVTYSSGDFKIQVFIPCKEDWDKLERSEVYGTTTVKGVLPLFIEDREYEIEVKKDTRIGRESNYNFINVANMEEELDGENAFEFLKLITSESIAKNILEKYPQFIAMVLENKPIDYSDINGVKDKRFAQIKEKIENQFKFFSLIIKYPEYKLSIKNARKLCNSFESLGDTCNQLDKNPYHCLINIVEYGFERADSSIIEKNNSWEDSFERLESCMVHLLKTNESMGNSYCNANDLYYEVLEYIENCGSKIKQVAIDSVHLHYEEDTKNISLVSTFTAEVEVARIVSGMARSEEEIKINVKKYAKTDKVELLDEQKEMLINALKYKISIVDAPAGTGKTFTTKALCNMLDDNRMTYTLLSPSGAGAKRLAEATNRRASTIHKAIGIGGEPKELASDFVLVDEFGMTDLKVFLALLNSLGENSRLVMVGNIDQLPSVGLGNCMYDMIKSGVVPTATFKTVHRFGVGGIMTASTMARMSESFLNENEKQVLGEDKGFEFFQANEDFEIAEGVINRVEELLGKGIKIDDIMILSPFNKGMTGSIKLSNVIHDICNPNDNNREEWFYERDSQKIVFRVGSRVINTKNNYEAMTLERYEDNKETGVNTVGNATIYNGMDGVVRSLDKEKMVVQFDEELIVFERDEINKLLLFYAISVHRAQGQERKYVIGIISSQHRRMITSNLTYVMLSRPRVKCYLYGDINTINEGIKIKENLERMTQLSDFLRKEALCHGR